VESGDQGHDQSAHQLDLDPVVAARTIGSVVHFRVRALVVTVVGTRLGTSMELLA
jgi:hypothetical protein